MMSVEQYKGMLAIAMDGYVKRYAELSEERWELMKKECICKNAGELCHRCQKLFQVNDMMRLMTERFK
jgi:hypothetical protein